MDTPHSEWKDVWAIVLLGGGIFLGYTLFKIRQKNTTTTQSPVSTPNAPTKLPNGQLAYEGQNWVTAQSCSSQVASASAAQPTTPVRGGPPADHSLQTSWFGKVWTTPDPGYIVQTVKS